MSEENQEIKPWHEVLVAELGELFQKLNELAKAFDESQGEKQSLLEWATLMATVIAPIRQLSRTGIKTIIPEKKLSKTIKALEKIINTANKGLFFDDAVREVTKLINNLKARLEKQENDKEN